MKIRTQMATILMAEDDPDDRLLIMDAFKETQLLSDIRFVEDGQALMDYLHQRSCYQAMETAPRRGSARCRTLARDARAPRAAP